MADAGGSTPHLERVIGVGGLGSSAVNCIVGSGIFGLPGIAAAMLGPAAVLAYLVCVVLIGLVGLCLAETGSRVAHGGGLYGYATEAFGPIAGGIAGTLLWVANSVVTAAAVANLFVDTLALTIPGMGSGVWRFVVLVTLYTVLAAVNRRGARAGTRLSMVLAVVKIAPLVLLVIMGLFAVRVSNLQWVAMPAASQIGQTAVLLFFAFIGIEGGLNVSGEVANPARTVPRAIFLALVLVAALYIGLQTVAQGVLGPALPGAAAPLVALATTLFGEWGTRLLLATTLLSIAGFLSADALGSPRILAALAERGQLPRRLATVHPRFKTPSVAIGVYAVMCAAIACTGSFRQLVIAGTSGTLVLYLICCLGLLRLRARNVAMFGPPFRAPGGPFVPLAASAIILWLLSTLAWAELAAAMALVAVSGVAYALQERSMRRVAAILLMLGCVTGQAAASQARGAPATGGRLSACTLMSRDLVEKFSTGNKQLLKQFKPEEEPLGANGSYCEDGTIGFQINPFARPDELRKSPGKDWQPQTGVGDVAFFHNKANTYAELMVFIGARHFTIQMSVPTGGTVESIKPNIIGLAQAIIAKLR